jgi:hypothetical protein
MKVQFSFWKKGYEEGGLCQALLIYKGKRQVVDKIFCEVPSYSVTRTKNPIFVIEAKASQVELCYIPKGKKFKIYAYIR